MESHLSPKNLAAVIGVSESSLKRWVDDERLAAVRTSGGHRRIPLHEAIRFIRETAQPVLNPGLLGLPDLNADAVETVMRNGGETALQAALESGASDRAKGIILAQYLSARSVASVCDGPICHAMHRIGELWRHSGPEGIAVEHRATATCVEAIHNIRLLLPPLREPKGSRLVAVGGAIETDPYTLPTLMAGTCLRELGIEDINLGADLPAESLLDTARREGAKLIWVSASSWADGFDPVRHLTRLAEGAKQLDAKLVLGGRRMFAQTLPALPATHLVHSMTELVSFARGLQTGITNTPAEMASVGAR